jgi:hypothetical protein
MDITHFNDLLSAAKQQPSQQRLLLVFVGTSLPSDATAQQRTEFESGESGELTPLMCVDKDPHDLSSFEGLSTEAQQMAPEWRLFFASALAGNDGLAPTATKIEAALKTMVESIRLGDLERMIPFDRHGDAVRLGSVN